MRSILIALCFLLAATSYADSSSCPSAQGVVSACRKSIQEHDKTIADQNKALQAQIEATSQANQRADKAEGKLASWTRDPIAVFAIGLVAGGLAGVWAAKR